MLRYKKGPEPKCLTTLSTSPHATWNNVYGDQRDEIRERLVHDQAGLCAYCQRRIRAAPPPVTMKIEHWAARNPDPATQTEGGKHFQWSNLLGVCDGVGPVIPPARYDAQPTREYHCDTERGNEALFLHPVDGQHDGHQHDPRKYLAYRGDGRVTASDDRAAQDLVTLNLNAEHLRRGRKAVLDALRDRLDRIGSQPWRLSDELKHVALKPGSNAPEHGEFLRYYLERWLRKQH